MVLQEPGEVHERRAKRIAEDHGYHAEVVMNKKAGSGNKAGMIIVMGREWQKVKIGNVASKDGQGAARLVKMDFKAASRRRTEQTEGARREALEPLHRLQVQFVYGYNSPDSPAVREQSNDLWKQVLGNVETFRTRHTLGSCMVIGDLNAARSSYYDTNRQIEESDDGREKEASIIDALEGAGLRDCFRTRFPRLRAVSRHPHGKLAEEHAARRIDHIMATSELSQGVATRIGIHQSAPINTDHLPVVADFAIDCAEIASKKVPVWDRVKVSKTRVLDEEVQNVERFQEQFTSELVRLGYSADLDGAAQYEKFLEAASSAADGTVSETKTMCYPRRVSTLKDYHTTDMVVRTWGKRLKGAANALRAGHMDNGVKKSLRRAAPPASLPDALELVEWNTASTRAGSEMQALAVSLDQQYEKVREYLKPKEVAARNEAIKAGIKARNDMFSEPQGKGKGRWLKSVFKEHRDNHQLAWARRTDGSLADTPEELGELVANKFRSWFASVTPVEQRWGSWNKMLNKDTAEMCTEKRQIAPGCTMSFKDFVAECYPDEDAPDPAIWKDFLTAITLKEVKVAIDGAKAHTAPGGSQMSIDVIKRMSDDNAGVLVSMFNTFLDERRVPDAMNAAILRLLPKTDQGLADLDKTRPIALIETLGKLYERVMITRLTKTIEKHGLLDSSQYGAVAGGGCPAPLKVLNDVMEDSRVSGQELHVVALDLRKAFDTCEFWSQGMSLKAIGLPDEAVKLLVDLDAGSNSPADPREGEGATTKVILDAGRMSPSFAHGRGVRQGSVGGPIKWVIFMNFWLKWISTTMKGKGYKMAGDASTEMIAQMFVDDSIWTCKDAKSAQELIRRVELFCDFHSIVINREKSEYIAMNDPGIEQVRWTPPRGPTEGQEHLGKVFQRKGACGSVKTRLKPGESDGRVIKYLGVVFEARAGWKGQERVLGEKHGKLLANLKFARISVEQAVYAINTKVIPAMAYPLQVAAISRTTLRKWDAAHRKVLRRVGALPTDLPVEMYHASREGILGGLGLISIEDKVDAMRVTAHMQAKGDHLEGTRGGKIPSMQQRTTVAIERAQHAEHHKKTLAAHTLASLKRLRMEVKVNEQGYTINAASAADRKAAGESEAGSSWKVYTDGGTEQEGSPKTPWAFWMRSVGGPTKRRGAGRLRGLQSNDLGEAMALLQALRAVRLDETVEAFVDNLQVVTAANAPLSCPPKDRLSQGGRAIWNRIRALLKERQQRGTTTTVEWVHSHVDDPKRRQLKDGCKQTCACGGSRSKPCDPTHEHHAGNEEADQGATAALLEEEDETEKQLHPAFGDDDALLYHNNVLCQGSIAKAVKGAIDDTRMNEMEARARGSGLQNLIKKLKGSVDSARSAVAAATKKVSARFRVRLWAEVLPTYSTIAMRCNESETSREVYGELIGKGECRCCGGGHVETVDHVLEQCTHPEVAKARTAAQEKAAAAWKQEGELQAWNVLQECAGTSTDKWQSGWFRRGLVPKAAMERARQMMKDNSQIEPLVKATAVIMAQGAVAMWEARNTAKGVWEKEVGIDKKLTAMNRAGWRRGVTRSPRKERRRKPDDEVTPEYAERRHFQEDRAERVNRLGEDEGGRQARVYKLQTLQKRKKQRASEEANSKAARLNDDIKKRIERVRDMVAKGLLEERAAERYPKVKSKSGHVAKALRRRQAAAQSQELCTVKGCGAPAAAVAMACKLSQPRCKRHELIRCSGIDAGCSCATEGTGTKRQTKRTKEAISSRLKHRQEELALGEGAVIRIDTVEGFKTAVVRRKLVDGCRPGERKPQYKFILQAGDASIHLGGAEGPRLRDVEWWLVKAKDDNDDDSCEEDSDSAENESVGTSEDSDSDGGPPSAKVTFNDRQKNDTETCAVHAMNNAMGRVRVTVENFETLGFGRTGLWDDKQIREVANAAGLTAVTVPWSEAQTHSAESVANAQWSGVLLLEGALRGGEAVNGGHWTAIRRFAGGAFAHVNSLGAQTREMTPEQVATRMRTVQDAMGYVMTVWARKRDPRASTVPRRREEAEPPPAKRARTRQPPPPTAPANPPSAKPSRCRKDPEEPKPTRKGAKKGRWDYQADTEECQVEITVADGECKTAAEGWGPKSKRRYPSRGGGVQVPEEKRPKINRSRTQKEAGLRGQTTEGAKRRKRDNPENRGQAAEPEPRKKRNAQAEPEQAQGEESTEHRNKRHGRRQTGNREGGPREGVG